MSDHALRARNFIALHQSGSLSTISRAHHGYPFGSAVQYDIDQSGRLLVFISRLAEHYRNLEQDSRASVLINDHAALLDPQPFGRATVVGRFDPVPAEEHEACMKRYFDRFPAASSRGLVHDFSFFRMEPERIRWIGGFGDIRWINGDAYSQAGHDAVCYAGMPVLIHMNIDHAGAVMELARAATPIEAAEKIAVCSGIDSRELTVSLLSEAAEGHPGAAVRQRRIALPFDAPLATAADSRRAIIALLNRARSGSSLASRPAEP